MEPPHTKRRRRHPFPAMTGLASEVADLVHLRGWMIPQVIDVREGMERTRRATGVALRRSEGTGGDPRRVVREGGRRLGREVVVTKASQKLKVGHEVLK